MTETTLLIDQGNSRLKWVLARNRELLEESVGRGDFAAFSDSCEHGVLGAPDAIFISSVAGSKATRNLADFCQSHWKIDPKLLQSQAHGQDVQSGYVEPEQLGVDRWLAIVGAVARYGKPVVVWDLGTASTIDAVDQNGQHAGGMIYPGPATMLKSLGTDTRLKVPADLSTAALSPGRSTAEGIENGVLAAQIGALNQFMHHASKLIGTNPKLVATGGAAVEIVSLLDFPCKVDPWLVFSGMLKEGIR